MHNWWNCDVITTFWKQVYKEIEIITTIKLPFYPEIALLDLWNNEIVHVDSEWLLILFAIARLVIAILWRSEVRPSINKWKIKLWDHFILWEFMKNILDLTIEKCEEKIIGIWFPILSYLPRQQIVLEKKGYLSMTF